MRVARGMPLGYGLLRKSSISEKDSIPRHSRHPALFQPSRSVASTNSTAPQYSSQATTLQMA
eukprot:CAMPEP_0196144572 /NCGR_PEP_ID=MMETSP0910-20130528/17012_1 /TAXON_ID=49265 /ORGANISM="Thalassiosira rotula, Strain GSO102" /LENGTH=61 /DNA_ID=CAMNT_0041406267 /DNA_START=1 /DNA_END=182 /DNA_ORIENTATION=+